MFLNLLSNPFDLCSIQTFFTFISFLGSFYTTTIHSKFDPNEKLW